MDRNTISGIVLIFVIFIFFSWWNTPSVEERAIQEHKRDSIAQVIQAQRSTDSLRNAVQANLSNIQEQDIETPEVYTDEALAENGQMRKDKFGAFANSSVGEENFVAFESDVLKLKFSNKGGRINEAELKNFVTSDSLPLVLFKGDTARFGFMFNTANRLINTQDHFYKVFVNGNDFDAQSKIIISGEDSVNISYRLYSDLESGFNTNQYIEFSYSLTGDSYMFDFDIRFVGLENVLDNRTGVVGFKWEQNLRMQEQIVDKYNGAGVYYKFIQDDVDNLSENKDEKEKLTGNLAWVSFKQRFFSSTLIANEHFVDVNIEQGFTSLRTI